MRRPFTPSRPRNFSASDPMPVITGPVKIWQQRLAAINSYLQEQFNRQLQAGYDQIAAAGALGRQISANNDAMLAAIDSRLQASRASSGGSSSGRSPTDKFSDY